MEVAAAAAAAAMATAPWPVEAMSFRSCSVAWLFPMLLLFALAAGVVKDIDMEGFVNSVGKTTPAILIFLKPATQPACALEALLRARADYVVLSAGLWDSRAAMQGKQSVATSLASAASWAEALRRQLDTQTAAVASAGGSTPPSPRGRPCVFWRSTTPTTSGGARYAWKSSGRSSVSSRRLRCRWRRSDAMTAFSRSPQLRQ